MADVYHGGEAAVPQAPPNRNDTLLFWASFIAIVATAFGFVIRAGIDWGTVFHLTKTQTGQILGVGLWPFAITIVLFSLIIDKIGYGKSMIFAFACHVVGAIATIMATDYKTLYWATFITALGNGTVEAVTNPVVATLFVRDKTKWLNRLHAGWPGGLVLGGLLALVMGSAPWQAKIALIFLPVLGYAALMFGRKFPINERVAAGVSYRPMLQQVGIAGAAVIVGLIVRAAGDALNVTDTNQLIIGLVLVAAFGLYVRTLGHPLFIFLLLIMIPLATTELGTDSWIGDLMTPAMAKLGLPGATVLIYTSAIMLVLRFVAGPIVHKLSPLGLLAACSVVAAGGLFAMSQSAGVMILVAATFYAFGKAFFWPTMLGVVSEQFPKGGALTLNATGGVGMLAVGVIGAPLLGIIQDTKIDTDLARSNPAIYAQVSGETRQSVLGSYKPIDDAKVSALPEAEKATVEETRTAAKTQALARVAAFPVLMFVCYVGLILYFRSRGGYHPQVITTGDEPELVGARGVRTA